jgi:hypothetical protein
MQFKQFHPPVNWPLFSVILRADLWSELKSQHMLTWPLNIVELDTSVCVLLLEPKPFGIRRMENNKRETRSQASKPFVMNVLAESPKFPVRPTPTVQPDLRSHLYTQTSRLTSVIIYSERRVDCWLHDFTHFCNSVFRTCILLRRSRIKVTTVNNIVIHGLPKAHKAETPYTGSCSKTRLKQTRKN